eukprot:5810968-Pyramimonas_sp.AAC.1
MVGPKLSPCVQGTLFVPNKVCQGLIAAYKYSCVNPGTRDQDVLTISGALVHAEGTNSWKSLGSSLGVPRQTLKRKFHKFVEAITLAQAC